MSFTDDFARAAEAVGRATSTFLSGNAEPFKACWSQGPDVTIFGGWGAYERGWDQVSARLDWAAARFVDGQHDQEVLTMDCGGEVGWTVCLERGEVRVIGQGVTAPIVLRVTHVYRREDAQWWVVHRHADPATGKTAPTAVLSNPTS